MTCSRIYVNAALAALLTTLTAASGNAAESPDPAAVREIGRRLFFDPALSASGKLACSSCHDPQHAYAQPNGREVQWGGEHLDRAGTRAVPSLRYTLRRTPVWSAQFPADPAERLLDLDSTPVGGFDWDGRFDTLHQQAEAPLLADNQMANANRAALVVRISEAAYAPELTRVFGADIWSDPQRVFALALLALERFELEDPSFFPFTSRYDAVLDGKATLTARERRGLALFNAPNKGNCASCHTSSMGADGSHPLFTDFGFQILGVPRNPRIPANRDPAYFDLGLCGPQRIDQASQAGYCGMFKTPSLRNVATRRVFFHNGSLHSLREVLRFYVARDHDARRWYPVHDGRVVRYDDLPVGLRANVNHFDAPLDRGDRGPPALDALEIDDVLAFLETLSDRDATNPTARRRAREAAAAARARRF